MLLFTTCLYQFDKQVINVHAVCYILMEKINCASQNNEIKWQSGGFSQGNFPGIIVNHMFTLCNWFRVNVKRWSRFVTTQVKSTLSAPLCRQRGIHSDYYSWSVLLVLRFEKNIFFLFITICWLFVWTQQIGGSVCSGHFHVHDVLVWNHFEFTMCLITT